MRNYLILALSLTFALVGCGPKVFVKGEYDDPNRVELLDDKFNEADLKLMNERISKAFLKCSALQTFKPAVLMMSGIENHTAEHIDLTSLTSKLRTTLIKTNRVFFVNKEERSTLAEEYQHGADGYVLASTQKQRGKQIGVDYVITGEIATNVQEMGNTKLIYYKLTVNLTNVETSIIACTEDIELRKQYHKQSI